MSALLVSCSSDDDDSSSNKEHDAHIFGEWVANDGKKYVHDYYSFNSDGTGIHGSYESDIDWVNEEDDIKEKVEEVSQNYNVVVLVPSFSRAKFWDPDGICTATKDNIEIFLDKTSDNSSPIKTIQHSSSFERTPRPIPCSIL